MSTSFPFPKVVKKLQFIPKQQFQTDFADLIRMKGVIDNGEILVLYPAGIQPVDGVSTPIPELCYGYLYL